MTRILLWSERLKLSTSESWRLRKSRNGMTEKKNVFACAQLYKYDSIKGIVISISTQTMWFFYGGLWGCSIHKRALPHTTLLKRHVPRLITVWGREVGLADDIDPSVLFIVCQTWRKNSALIMRSIRYGFEEKKQMSKEGSHCSLYIL